MNEVQQYIERKTNHSIVNTRLKKQRAEKELVNEMPTLHCLCLNNPTSAVAYAIANRCDVNRKGPFGFTPLHLVTLYYAKKIHFGKRELDEINAVAESLIALGADPLILCDLNLNACAVGEGYCPPAIQLEVNKRIDRKRYESDIQRTPRRGTV